MIIGRPVPPSLVVTSTSSAAYSTAIYSEMEHTTVTRFPPEYPDVTRRPDLGRLCADYSSIGADVFHLHWPEWFLGPFVIENRQFIEFLRDQHVPILWTQHNFRPHASQRDSPASPANAAAYEEIYGLWADAAAGVVHLSNWGMAEIRKQLQFSPEARHEVIRHPHFGGIATNVDLSKEEAAEQLGLPPSSIRLGVVGSPRANKSVQLVLDSFASVPRDDMQLVVYCLDGTESVPDDRRIIARPYERVDRALYDMRLQSFDALILPFEGGMLATGTVSDAVAFGLPAVASNWPYLDETLGGGQITYGSTNEDLRRTLMDLDRPALDAARIKVEAMQEVSSPKAISLATEAFLEELAATRT